MEQLHQFRAARKADRLAGAGHAPAGVAGLPSQSLHRWPRLPATAEQHQGQQRGVAMAPLALEIELLGHQLASRSSRCRAVLAVDGAIDGMALQLAGQLPGAVGAVLAQAAAPGLEVIAVLKREPQAELQALLDALEPVDDCACLAPGQ